MRGPCSFKTGILSPYSQVNYPVTPPSLPHFTSTTRKSKSCKFPISPYTHWILACPHNNPYPPLSIISHSVNFISSPSPTPLLLISFFPCHTYFSAYHYSNTPNSFSLHNIILFLSFSYVFAVPRCLFIYIYAH